MAEKDRQIDKCLTELEIALKDLKSAADTVGRGPGGREVSLAITNLQQAEHWLKDAKDILEQEQGK